MILSDLYKKIREFPIILLSFMMILIIGGYLLGLITPYNNWGIIPRTFDLSSLFGILFSWTMHGDFSHLKQNLIGLLPLLILVLWCEKQPLFLIIKLVILSGLFTWLLGSYAIHIGVSGLIFALMGFIILSGIIRKQWFYLLFVLFSIGDMWYSISHGLIPQTGVSFVAHFGGFIAGLAVAYQKYIHQKQEFTHSL